MSNNEKGVEIGNLALKISPTKYIRRLEKIVSKLERCERLFSFNEVYTEEERQELMELRKRTYLDKNIPEPKSVNGKDIFDDEADYFVLREYLDGNRITLKAVRVINKGNRYGVLPLELSLMGEEELRKFSSQTNGEMPKNLKISTMNFKDKQNIESILKKYQGSKKIYEVGGLFGNFNLPFFLNGEKTALSNEEVEVLILGIGIYGYERKWDLVLQEHKPSHTKGYEYIFPYEKLANNYKDHCNRPAVVLSLEGADFQEVYEGFYKRVKDILL